MKKANFEHFESSNKSGRHIRITVDMIKSQAWKELKPIAVKLYDYTKSKYRGDKESETFTCTYNEINKYLGFCDASITAAFKDLFDKGFLNLVENNRNRRMPNKYKFSDTWQSYKRQANKY